MILCEVALGIPKIGNAFGQPISSIEDGVMPPPLPSLGLGMVGHVGNVIHLPNDDYQSIQAFDAGATVIYQEIDGVRIANGHNLHYMQHHTFNEFIVFDPNQIKIKYLFKLKFS